MTEPSTAQASQPPPPAIEPGADPDETVWQRLQRHKVLQWTLAYAAAAYTLLHATQMVVESFEWPHLIVRVVALGLVLALPVVVLLAWYHGHKAQHRFSTAELSILTVLLLIAGTVMWGFTRARAPTESAPNAAAHASTGTASASVAPAANEPAASVAVVPFANLTGDPSKDYFSDGMAEELINLLAQVPGLKVPARTSSFAYKGRNIDIRRIARDLGVATILEGSVRSAGERIRVTAQLVNAQTGYHEWSRDYDRQFTDIFKLQDELAAAIVQALKSTMGATISAPGSRAPPTEDVEAYRLYLQAGSIGSRRTEEAFRHGLELFNEAIARDPNFARAIAARAGHLLNFPVLGYPMPGAIEDAERDAERAIALDPNLPDALDALATVDVVRGDWVSAELNWRRALVLSSNDAVTMRDHETFLLQSVGKLHQAHLEALEAYRRAPADIGVITMLAFVKSRMGMDADAVKLVSLAVEMGRAREVPPVPEIFADAAAREGRYAEAAEQRIDGLSAALRDAGGAEVLRVVYAALGDPSKKVAARQALRDLVKRIRTSELGIFTQNDVMIYFARLGAIDDAYEFANQSLDESARSGTVGGLWGGLWTPEMRPFRQDPRFKQLAARLKLFDYWKQYGPPDDCDLKGDVLTCR